MVSTGARFVHIECLLTAPATVGIVKGNMLAVDAGRSLWGISEYKDTR